MEKVSRSLWICLCRYYILLCPHLIDSFTPRWSPHHQNNESHQHHLRDLPMRISTTTTTLYLVDSTHLDGISLVSPRIIIISSPLCYMTDLNAIYESSPAVMTHLSSLYYTTTQLISSSLGTGWYHLITNTSSLLYTNSKIHSSLKGLFHFI